MVVLSFSGSLARILLPIESKKETLQFLDDSQNAPIFLEVVGLFKIFDSLSQSVHHQQ